DPEAELAGAVDVAPLREVDGAERHALPLVGRDRYRRNEGLVAVVGVALQEHEPAAQARALGRVPETAAAEKQRRVGFGIAIEADVGKDVPVFALRLAPAHAEPGVEFVRQPELL